MRRLTEDQRHEHSSLTNLTGTQRLFVQRWIEIFDREAILGVRCRPFWPDKIASEIKSHYQRDSHTRIMNDELSACTLAPITSINFENLQSQPVELAEALGSAVSALGFDHGFLFHAYKAMLYPPKVPFRERLEKLRQWWIANSTPRPINVVLRTNKGGMVPATGSTLQLVKWKSLPPQILDCAQHCVDWWTTYQQPEQSDSPFFLVSTSACDSNNAVAIALERYSHYSIFEASPAGKRPIGIDDRWAFVDDPNQSPSGRTYALRVDRYSFRLRRPFDLDLVPDFNEAAAADEDFATFWKHYSKAMKDIKDGEPNDALDDIAKAIELAYSGYIRNSIEEKANWQPPRLFVEKSAILLALDWCRTHYHYLLEYVLKPSYAIEGDLLFGAEKRPNRIYEQMSDEDSWKSKIARCDWDELLKYRRNKTLNEPSSLPTVLPQRRRQAQWDLARAVRARNSLFHRGEPLQDQYLLAIFLDAFDLILRLRLAAHKHAMKFNDLMHAAEQDYFNFVSGTLRPNTRMFASFGWQGWRLPSEAS
jgi:hypothetical protein